MEKTPVTAKRAPPEALTVWLKRILPEPIVHGLAGLTTSVPRARRDDEQLSV